jgi:2-keto-3-deoxy-L-rhamnonate aldolase RhmA
VCGATSSFQDSQLFSRARAPDAVRNIDQIVKIPGIDVLHIGPYDLSLDMGVDMTSPILAQAIQNVSIAAQRFGTRSR